MLAIAAVITQHWHFLPAGTAKPVNFITRKYAVKVYRNSKDNGHSLLNALLFNLRIALRHLGDRGKSSTFPDPSTPDFLARIQLGKTKQASTDEHMLFEAIPKRRSNRRD